MTWLGLWLILCPVSLAVMLLCQRLSSGKPRRRSWQAPAAAMSAHHSSQWISARAVNTLRHSHILRFPREKCHFGARGVLSAAAAALTAEQVNAGTHALAKVSDPARSTLVPPR